MKPGKNSVILFVFGSNGQLSHAMAMAMAITMANGRLPECLSASLRVDQCNLQTKKICTKLKCQWKERFCSNFESNTEWKTIIDQIRCSIIIRIFIMDSPVWQRETWSPMYCFRLVFYFFRYEINTRMRREI